MARLIYIALEGQGLSRRVKNEHQLMALLDAFGFQRVVMERLDLCRQIATAAEARCLATPHGAGMTHCLFLPEGALVLEVFNGSYVRIWKF